MDYADCPECAGEDFDGSMCDFHEIKDLKNQRLGFVVLSLLLFYAVCAMTMGSFKPRIPESKDPYTVEHSGSAWVTTDAKGERK